MNENHNNQVIRNRQVSINGRCIDLTGLETTLCEGSLVEECAVLPREGADGVTELVAYVVPSLPYAPDRLEAEVKSRMQSGALLCFCVPVTSIPLTEAGEVDEKALIQIPVVDEGLVRRWYERLHALPGISQAAVVIHEQTADHSPLHLSDLIPSWKSAAMKVEDVAPMAPQDQEVSLKNSQPNALAFADGGPQVIPSDSTKTLA